MAVYSKTLSDEQILSIIPTEAKNILIVVCGGCVNESIAYDQGLPILVDGNPYASKSEGVRICKMLSQKGFSVEITPLKIEFPILCVCSSENPTITLESSSSYDVILALSCISGALGLRVITNKFIESIVKQVGYISYTYSDIGNKRELLKEQSCHHLFVGQRGNKAFANSDF